MEVLCIRWHLTRALIRCSTTSGNGKAASIPYVGIVLIVLTILFVFVTTSTKYGKKVYAVGSNLKGARMAGINVAAMKISVVFDLWCTGRYSSISLDCHERILRPGNNRNQL